MKQRTTLALLTLFTLIPHQLASLEGNFQARQRAARKKRNTLLIVVGVGVCIALAAGGTYLYQKQNEDEHQNQPQDPASKLKKILNKIDFTNLSNRENIAPIKEFVDFLTNNKEALKKAPKPDDETLDKFNDIVSSPQVKTIRLVKRYEESNKQIPKFNQQDFIKYIKKTTNTINQEYTKNPSILKTNFTNFKTTLKNFNLLVQYKKLVLENRKAINQKAQDLSLTTNSTYMLTAILQGLKGESEKQKLLLDDEHFYLGGDFDTAYPRLNLNNLGLGDYTPPTSS